MPLSKIISMISAIDKISIHDGQGVVRYNGPCADFRATMSEKDKTELLESDVDQIRAYDNVIVLLLK